MPRVRLNRDDQVAVHFNREEAAPFRMFGKYVWMDEKFLLIEGTSGDYIGKDCFIPVGEVKMIERISPATPESY